MFATSLHACGHTCVHACMIETSCQRIGMQDPDGLIGVTRAAAVCALHAQLRDCCHIMGIGLGGARNGDTVTEEGAELLSSGGAAKDLGDVK